jgi:hypothetical protein
VRRSSLRRISSSPESKPRRPASSRADPTAASELSSRLNLLLGALLLRGCELDEIAAEFAARLESLPGIRFRYGKGTDRDLIHFNPAVGTERLVLNKHLHLPLDSPGCRYDRTGKLDRHRPEIVLHSGDHGPCF